MLELLEPLELLPDSLPDPLELDPPFSDNQTTSFLGQICVRRHAWYLLLFLFGGDFTPFDEATQILERLTGCESCF